MSINDEKAHEYVVRAINYNSKGDIERAFLEINEGIKLYPDYHGAYAARGLMHFENENYNQAIIDYETALQLNPNNNLARQLLNDTKKRILGSR